MPTETQPSLYTKLDPDFKAKWIKALRSGKYEQAYHTLRLELDGKFSYCCLGVACNLLDSKQWTPSTDEPLYFNWGEIGYFSDNLPFVDTEATKELIRLNDDEEWKFEVIADWLEENL